MLTQLHVQNLAIVEEANVAFERGLNVITGETGAGKSVLIGALQLVLGGRSDRTLIRTGEEKLSVTAEFQLAETSVIDRILEEIDIEPCDGGQLLIRRSLTSSGSSRISVNDTPATVAALRRIGEQLVDIHGPHDHQSLLDPNFQLEILDAFGQITSPLSAYSKAYNALQELKKQRAALAGDDDAIEREIDMLSFQVEEIEQAQLSEDDEEQLEQDHAEAANATLILEKADAITQSLTEGEPSAFDAVVAAQNAIRELARILPDAEAWGEEGEAIAIQMQELSGAIASRAQQIEADPDHLQHLEDRMALVQKLKRKYGGSIADILERHAKNSKRLDALSSRGENIGALDQQITAADEEIREQGKALHDARKKAAGKLAKAITAELRDLGFAKAGFSVELNACEPTASGMDEVVFGFAPNVGEAMRPLRAIASSGEISRVMLAVKGVLALHDRIPLLVFDEIDANVGGEIGNAVGIKLKEVAKHHQVLCITHLPQVAVCGSTHFVVGKQVSDGRTRTTIDLLDSDQRPEEVARMLGGKDLTSVTLDHAREMLAQRA